MVIGWDAADWLTIRPLLDRGEMPFLKQLIERGAAGPLTTLQPVLSPMLWSSISTGHFASEHGIHGFTKTDENTGHMRPFGSMDRTARAYWNIASHHGLKSHVLNWFCSHPAEPVNGIFLSDLVSGAIRTSSKINLTESAIHPASKIPLLKDWILRPNEIDPEVIRLFVPDFAEIDQTKSKRLSSLAGVLAESLTVHNAATHIAEKEDWDVLSVYYPLIDHAGHGFMAFHPPQQDFVGDFEYRMYKDVMNSVYRFSDLMLGRLMALAGSDCNIILCSDHGFFNDHRRLRPGGKGRMILDQEHSPIGILVASGPSFEPGTKPVGASLLNIAPTILHTLGLPVGKDMPGRVLLEIMREEQPVKMIPSWEDVPGDFFELDRNSSLSEEENKALLQNFIDMGYVDPAAANKKSNYAEVIETVNRYNLARVYAHAGKHDKALELLVELYAQNPLRLDIALATAESFLALELYDEGREILEIIAAVFQRLPRVHFFLGFIEMQQGNYEAALESFEKLAKVDQSVPVLFIQAGHCCIYLHKLDRAEQFFQKAIEKDSENPAGLLGMSELYFRRKQFEESVEAAYDALDLLYAMPKAHFCLGRALAYLGQYDDAVIAFEQCVAMQPTFFPAHRYLARIYKNRLSDPERASAHEMIIENATFWRREHKEKRNKMRTHFQALRETMESSLDEPTEEPSEEELPQSLVEPARSSAKPIVIVSGLPRSGTSLMMQMLAAVGLPILTDGSREADADNPKGYLEYNPIRELAKRPDLLEEMDGKVVKVISSLLPYLNFGDNYKVIFMRRPANEIARSQVKMIERIKGQVPKSNPDRYLKTLEKHSHWGQNYLDNHPKITPLVLDYPDLIQNPAAVAAQLVEFLELDTDSIEALVQCVDPTLYRNRESVTEGDVSS